MLSFTALHFHHPTLSFRALHFRPPSFPSLSLSVRSFQLFLANLRQCRTAFSRAFFFPAPPFPSKAHAREKQPHSNM